MTTEPRFLALVAKVEEQLEDWYAEHYGYADFLRALKVAISAHEPTWDGHCGTCRGEYDDVEAKWPCKPFLDMEAEVGK